MNGGLLLVGDDVINSSWAAPEQRCSRADYTLPIWVVMEDVKRNRAANIIMSLQRRKRRRSRWYSHQVSTHRGPNRKQMDQRSHSLFAKKSRRENVAIAVPVSVCTPRLLLARPARPRYFHSLSALTG